MLQRQAVARLTFQVEENIGLVVLEHLRHELCVHVLHVDILQVPVQHHQGLVQFLLRPSQFVSTVVLVLVMTDNIDNDTGEQLALLMLVRAFLCASGQLHVSCHLRMRLCIPSLRCWWGWMFTGRVWVVAGRINAVSRGWI
jgi:hypothetical protein